MKPVQSAKQKIGRGENWFSQRHSSGGLWRKNRLKGCIAAIERQIGEGLWWLWQTKPRVPDDLQEYQL